jgi:predicted esterase
MRHALLVFGLLPVTAFAQGTLLERSATLADLFGAAEARELARTLPPDRAVNFRLRIPSGGAPRGVLVFVKPDDSGAFIDAWAPVFDQRRLVWVSADGFGNGKPSAQRTLVAMMAVKVAAREASTGDSPIYIGGMSGGGRVASQTITRLPREFAGALCIGGADFHLPGQPLRSLVLERRFVFVTGARDFNRREMRRVFARYRDSGATHIKLLDLRHLGHEYPDTATLREALAFLEDRSK